ncbi:MAG: hypothetical protein GYA34_03030, partial [Chloroflexi bacterium]|nr:hypothetical protein [Chloroflexota bacterium]
MKCWCEYLNSDPLPWLLESEKPSVSHWTQVDILTNISSCASFCFELFLRKWLMFSSILPREIVRG